MPIFIHVDQTNLVMKEFIHMAMQEIVFLGVPKREIPIGQGKPILAARVANQNTGFASS